MSVSFMRYLTYRPANNVKRTIAYLIDTVPIQMALYLISHAYFDVSPIVDRTMPPATQMAAAQAKALIGYGTVGIWILYCIVAELTPLRGTYGKVVMGIRVRPVKGTKLTFGQVIGRNMAKIISFLPCCLGFIFAYFTNGNRAWHDSLSGTAVSDNR
ncbi:MAG TPA: RDD family protein [Haloferula sp.]